MRDTIFTVELFGFVLWKIRTTEPHVIMSVREAASDWKSNCVADMC